MRYCPECGKVFEYEPCEPDEMRCPACGKPWVAPEKTDAGDEGHCTDRPSRHRNTMPTSGEKKALDERTKTWLVSAAVVTVVALVCAICFGILIVFGPPANPIPADGCFCGEPSGGRNCAVAIDILTNITCEIWTDLSPETLRGIDGITWVSKNGGMMTRDPRYDWNGILDDICALHDQIPDDEIWNKSPRGNNPRLGRG